MAKFQRTGGILVTGGAGFVGSHIVDTLLASNINLPVAVFDLPPETAWRTARDGVRYISGDVRKLEDCVRALWETKSVAVIHTAGVVPTAGERYSQRNREAVFEINVDGTRNMLQAAKAAGFVKAFVLTASITMVTDDNGTDYPNFDETTRTSPNLVYGQSKVEAERLVLREDNEHFATCSIRPAVICGPGDYQLVTTIRGCIDKFETPFVIGDGGGLYDFVFVGNVADAHVLALNNLLTTKTAAGEAFLITNGSPIPFRAFCLAIWAHFGHVPPFEVHIPKPIAWFAGLLMECVTWVTGGEATLSRGSVKDYCQNAYANIDKARRVLGYEPRVSLAEGLKTSCDELRKRLELEGRSDERYLKA